MTSGMDPADSTIGVTSPVKVSMKVSAGSGGQFCADSDINLMAAGWQSASLSFPSSVTQREALLLSFSAGPAPTC